MSEIADNEFDAIKITDFVYDRNNIAQKAWKTCLHAALPNSEVVFMSKMIKVL